MLNPMICERYDLPKQVWLKLEEILREWVFKLHIFRTSSLHYRK